MTFNSNPSVNKIRYYSGFVMVTVYLTLGLLFLFTDIAIEMFPAYRKPIGATMVIYGIVRIILTVQKNKQDQRQNER